MNYTPETLGPRVIVKDDRDSSVGRGCQLYAAHFVPVMMDMMQRMVQAFALRQDCKTIRMTEGWRNIRDRRDCHEEARAIDWTAEHPDGSRFEAWEYDIVSAQARKWLGQNYDVIVHGQGLGLHIHVEYDPQSRG